MTLNAAAQLQHAFDRQERKKERAARSSWGDWCGKGSTATLRPGRRAGGAPAKGAEQTSAAKTQAVSARGAASAAKQEVSAVPSAAKVSAQAPAQPGDQAADRPDTSAARPAGDATSAAKTISVAHFGDDASLLSQTSNRSAPYLWDRIAAGTVRVAIGGHDLPFTTTRTRPVFASDISGAEWTVTPELRAGAVVLALTAPDQSGESDSVESVTITEPGSGYAAAPKRDLLRPAVRRRHGRRQRGDDRQRR